LLLARLRPTIIIVLTATFLAFGFFTAFTLGSLDVGRISGLEWDGIIVVAFIRWVNVAGMKAVVTRKGIA